MSMSYPTLAGAGRRFSAHVVSSNTTSNTHTVRRHTSTNSSDFVSIPTAVGVRGPSRA